MARSSSIIALIVEADLMIRAHIIERLNKYSIQCIEAGNGMVALQQLEKHPVDFVISDVRMKKMDGIQFIEIVHRNHKDIPVVVTVGSNDEEAAIDAFRAGAINIIKKTDKLDEFEKIILPITELIDKRKTQKFDFNSVRTFTEEISIVCDPTLIPVTVDHLLGFLDRSKYAKRLTGLEIALYEMLANAIEHGNLAITDQEKKLALSENCYNRLLAERRNVPAYKNRLVKIRLDYNPKQLSVTIIDEGEGFRVENYITPTEENLLAQSGRGILLSRMYCDELLYNNKGNQVVLKLNSETGTEKEGVVHSQRGEQAKPNILIVDNNPQILRHISNLIQEFGFSFGYIAQSHHLFLRLEEEAFDLILLDVNMPKTDGLTLLKQLKASNGFNGIPVIMLTSDRDDRLMAECFLHGAEDFIVKPVNKVALQSRIESALTKQQSFQELGKANEKLEQLNSQLQDQYDILIETKKELENKHIQIQEDIRLAERIQRSILTSDQELKFLNTSVMFRPHGIVSGDFHFQQEDKSGNINVFLGDATGHGVSAAFLTMMVRMALGITDSDLKPDDIVRSLNRQMADCVPRGNHMTGIFLKISPSGLMEACSAGGPPGLIVSMEKEDRMILHEGGQALGMFEEERVPYQLESYQLSPHDKIILFTDGILEWRNHLDEPFGIEGVKSYLANHKSDSVKAILKGITEKVEQFASKESQDDDMTMVGIEFLLT